MAKSKTKTKPVKFIGGSRDGVIHEVPDHVQSLTLAPVQTIDEYIFPVDETSGKDLTSPVFVTETYTRRGVTVDEDDIEFFSLEDLSDYDALTRLFDQYQGQPVEYVSGEPVEPEETDAD